MARQHNALTQGEAAALPGASTAPKASRSEKTHTKPQQVSMKSSSIATKTIATTEHQAREDAAVIARCVLAYALRRLDCLARLAQEGDVPDGIDMPVRMVHAELKRLQAAGHNWLDDATPWWHCIAVLELAANAVGEATFYGRLLADLPKEMAPFFSLWDETLPMDYPPQESTTLEARHA